MHEIPFRLELRVKHRWGSLQRSPRSLSWISEVPLLTERGKGKGGDKERRKRKKKERKRRKKSTLPLNKNYGYGLEYY